VDKGKGKLIEPEKPKKAAPFLFQTSGAFKILEKDLVPPTPPVFQPVKRGPAEKKKPVKKMTRVLKLVNEEENPEAG
jgi:hypothetical protein